MMRGKLASTWINRLQHWKAKTNKKTNTIFPLQDIKQCHSQAHDSLENTYKVDMLTDNSNAIHGESNLDGRRNVVLFYQQNNANSGTSRTSSIQ